ncbi:MAG TPA: alpha/beta hydrolase [Micromonosporaceae bacterium]
MAATVDTDLLGAPFESRIIDLGCDDEGPVVATLVRRRPEQPSGRAVLYVHGFNDYFFQTHLAEFFTDRGWDFYAIDLRKYGRSLLPHQTPNFCRDLTDYFPELDAASEIIRTEHGNRTLLLMGHSTGGLLISIWAHARRQDGIVDGLVLNSPFFDFNVPWVVRRPLLAVASSLARWLPYQAIRSGVRSVYGESLHVDHRGEWRYDLAWKPVDSFPVRLGWLAAIRRAQRQLHAGLAIPVPVLVGSAGRSLTTRDWHEAAMSADTVLDVEHMARWAPRLGRHVTIVRFEGGLHDLTLSRSAVRDRFFTELDRWLDFATPLLTGSRPTTAPAPPQRVAPVSAPAPAASDQR